MSATLEIREPLANCGVSPPLPGLVTSPWKSGRELWRNLWLALASLFAFAWLRECPSYCGYLLGMHVEPVQLTAWGKVALVWLVLAKSAQALLPAVVALILLANCGRMRLSRFVLSGWVSLLIVWLFVDQIAFVMTSHHSAEYLELVVNRDAWQWAGNSAPIAGKLLLVSGVLFAMTWGLLELFAIVDQRLAKTNEPAHQRRAALQSFMLLAIVILGWPLPRLAISSADARTLSQLERNLAWRPVFCRVDHSSSLAAQSELKSFASKLYADVKSELSQQPLDQEFHIDTNERRHVVMLVLESFRRDLLTAEAMPFCEGLSHDGLFLERHYSNSNTSHYGMFSLLYGRLPFLYDELLDRRIPSQASATFRNSGYRNTFITSGDCSSWLRMGEYLNRDSFDEVLVLKQPSWIDRDRQALSRVAELLRSDAHEHPQFVVCFLVATHFPYVFPPEHRRFEPVAKAKDVLAAQSPQAGGDPAAFRNRQRNAAHFLDAEIQKLVTSADRSQTLFVVTGDHAESFRDDGCFFHGSRLSEAQTGVPALFWGANVPARRIPQMTSHVDVLPTLCELLTSRRGSPHHLHGRNALTLDSNSLQQVFLTHGRMTNRDLFQRTLLVTPEWRLPMLLHSAKGAGITLLDPVNAMDRTLPSREFSAESLQEFSHRLEVAFRTLHSASSDAQQNRLGKVVPPTKPLRSLEVVSEPTFPLHRVRGSF